MERAYKDRFARKLGGGRKDMPLCERCGKPVRITNEDYTREEILCPTCATEANVQTLEDYESTSSR